MSIVNRTVLARQFRSFAESDPSMASLQRAMALLHPRRRPPRSVAEMAELVLLTIVRDHERHTTGAIGRLNGALARVLDDLADIRAGQLTNRTAAAVANDFQTIDDALNSLSTLEARVHDMLGTGTPDSLTARLRGQLEAELGTSRSLAPVGEAAFSPNPPRFDPRVGASANFVSAADELHAALREAPPLAPRTLPEGATSMTGRQLHGTQRARVNRAAQALVDAAGGDSARAVRMLLSRSDPDTNRMAIAVLVQQERLRPGAQATHRGPQSEAFGFQERMGGTPFEFVGTLREPIRGHATVGIDAINGGFIVDPKWTGVPTDVTPHLVGGLARADRAPHPEADVVALIRHTGLSRVDAESIVSGHIATKVVNLMERQLEYASQNGLRGVAWMCSTQELADAFERVFHEHLHGRFSGVVMDFRVGGGH
jgi:hypothetical protein